MLRLLLLQLAIALLAGCSSTSAIRSSASTGSAPSTVVLMDHRNGNRITLISDTWMRANGVPGEDFVGRRAAFYSQRLTGDNLLVKAMDDDIAKGVRQLMDQSGFARYGKPGAAPPKGGEIVQALEILQDGQTTHMGISVGTPADEIQAFKTCVLGFMDVYNNLLQLQTVDRMPAFKTSTGAPR